MHLNLSIFLSKNKHDSKNNKSSLDFIGSRGIGYRCYLCFYFKRLDRLYAPVEELENPNYKFATEIFSEDGKVLGTWSYSKENRVYTAYKDLSPNIINALIATEDVRFVEHSELTPKRCFVHL